MEPFQQYGNDFGLIDFMDEGNFDQYVDLIRGENEQTEPIFNYGYQGYDYQDQNNIGVDGHFFAAAAPPSVELFDFDVGVGHVGDDIHNNNNSSQYTDFSLLNACQNLEAVEEEILMGEDESSGSGGTTTTTATGSNEGSKTANTKADRSRTLVSERKRRSRMKEKLYALRSLVPNITKMDKASIVGDAVLYVQDMQMQAKKLKAEIASLESSMAEGDKITKNAKTTNSRSFYPIIKKILKMEVIQVEERGFYVKITSNKGKGVAMSLYKAIESLTTFNIHNSNLAASADTYVFTFTLQVTMPGEIHEVNLENMKLWMVRVLLNQGFEFQTSL